MPLLDLDGRHMKRLPRGPGPAAGSALHGGHLEARLATRPPRRRWTASSVASGATAIPVRPVASGPRPLASAGHPSPALRVLQTPPLPPCEGKLTARRARTKAGRTVRQRSARQRIKLGSTVAFRCQLRCLNSGGAPHLVVDAYVGPRASGPGHCPGPLSRSAAHELVAPGPGQVGPT